MNLINKLGIGIAVVVLAAACGDDGGGSGIAGTKTLGSLTDSEITALCVTISASQGGAGHEYTCDGETDSVDTLAECDALFKRVRTNMCPATVMQAETCAEAIGDDLCALDTTVASNPNCMAVVACFSEG